MAGAGFAVLGGNTWGRVVAILLAGISVVVNFALIPYYPFRTIFLIALDVIVIWALTDHARRINAPFDWQGADSLSRFQDCRNDG